MKISLAASMLFLSVLGGSLPAKATPTDSISLYFSAPFVTGSSVTEGAYTEDFNGYQGSAAIGASVPCPTVIPGFATVSYPAGACTIQINAATNKGNSEPEVGAPYSSYVSKTTNTTFTFDSGVKYVGFWWMMGSNGNNVEFQDASGTAIASFNVNDVITFLGSNSLVNNADTRTVTNISGGTYLTKRYYRGPGHYIGTVANPVMDYNVTTYANEPWVYLNLYVSGDITVNKVKFTGNNFEMDNLTVATEETGPRPDMVLVKNVLNTPPAAQVITWDPTNTTLTGENSAITPDNLATSNGTGEITYEVIDAGTSGCTVDSVTGVIKYTAIGDCVVRARAASVPGDYYSAYKDVTFSFTENPVIDPTDKGSGDDNSGDTSGEDVKRTLAETGYSPILTLSIVGALLIAGAFALVLGRRKRY